MTHHNQSFPPVTDRLLNTGQGQGLTNKLNSASKQLEKGNTAAALNKLNEFIAQVIDFASDGILTPQQAEPLFNAANDTIDLINSAT